MSSCNCTCCGATFLHGQLKYISCCICRLLLSLSDCTSVATWLQPSGYLWIGWPGMHYNSPPNPPYPNILVLELPEWISRCKWDQDQSWRDQVLHSRSNRCRPRYCWFSWTWIKTEDSWLWVQRYWLLLVPDCGGLSHSIAAIPACVRWEKRFTCGL